MRAVGVFILAIAALATAQSPEQEEYQRKLKEYEKQKAVYDAHQAVANVPVKASNDLIPKVAANQIPPGYAEQLLPTFTGIPVEFLTIGGPVIVPEVVKESNPVLRQAPVTPPNFLPPAIPPPTRAAGLPRPGQQNVFNPAQNVRPALQRGAPTGAGPQGPRGRPNGLVFFTNARVNLPGLGGQRAAPLPSRVKVQGFRNPLGRLPFFS